MIMFRHSSAALHARSLTRQALILATILCFQGACHAQATSGSVTDATAPTSSVGGQTPSNTGRLATAGDDTLTLSAGDLLAVEVFDTPELSVSRARIGQDGFLRMPVVGEINVLGLTPLQASAKIEQALRDQQIMLNPHVTVLVNEYSSEGVRVLGEVRNPGVYTLLGQHSLLDALSVAGGTTAEQGGTITITHARDVAHPEVIDVYTARHAQIEQETQVRPGDVVLVSRAAPFYVTGDVGAPGQYFIGNGRPIHFVEGLALARGATATAALTHAAILRRTETGVQRIPVNVRRVEHNSDPDPILQADDIIIVPRSALKQTLLTAIPYATGIFIGTALTRALP